MMPAITLLGFGACTPDAALRDSLPFAAAEIDRAAIPAALRRRTSQATQLAFSAAIEACRHARREPSELPAVFASVGGEIQVTDTLCIELGKPDGLISPTAFHNAVHNTAAGYWSIVQGCTRAASALAAGRETFAMALLEAWCLLEAQGGEILLVCYDERWPDYLAAPMGAPPFASALVLAVGRIPGGIAEIGRPRLGAGEPWPEPLSGVIANAPAAAAIPLLAAATAGEGDVREIALSALAPGWMVEVKRKGGLG
jgi:hypothetical protein